MGRGKKAVREELKVTFAAIPAPTGGRGIFGIEEAADAVRAVGSGKSTKGRRARELVVDCGTLTVRRGYDVCLGCRETSPLLEERLGLGEEQGRLREKLALLAVLVPYHQAPQVCQTLLGSER